MFDDWEGRDSAFVLVGALVLVLAYYAWIGLTYALCVLVRG